MTSFTTISVAPNVARDPLSFSYYYCIKWSLPAVLLACRLAILLHIHDASDALSLVHEAETLVDVG